jgi:hypothetical protein
MPDMERSATVVLVAAGLPVAALAADDAADAAGLEPAVPELLEQAAAARPSAPAPTAMAIQDLTVISP